MPLVKSGGTHLANFSQKITLRVNYDNEKINFYKTNQKLIKFNFNLFFNLKKQNNKMSLKKRNLGKFENKFCNVVDQLITLADLGFIEHEYSQWIYTIWQKGNFSKTLIASGNSLYLRDQTGDKWTDVSLCTLWNRNIAGPINESQIRSLIHLLKIGNVRA